MPTRIMIDVDASGRGTVIVDGKDISNEIVGFTLRARVGEVTRFRPEYTAAVVGADAQVEP